MRDDGARARSVLQREGVIVKAATAKLLRAVIRLVEDDVRELADTVVEIDEREAAHYLRLRNEVDAIRSTVIEHLSMHVDGIEHSRKVTP